MHRFRVLYLVQIILLTGCGRAE